VSVDDVMIVFVCWGNICRSPMAERIAEKKVGDAGITGVRLTSAATSTDELGNPMDSRAARELEAHGYRSTNHRAHQITAQEIREADLVVCMENIHIEKIRRLVPDADNLVLLTDFDPNATDGSGIDDPWYGPASGFATTRKEIEAAMDGFLDWVRVNRS
jgi:protein-tyrosine phosphatase